LPTDAIFFAICSSVSPDFIAAGNPRQAGPLLPALLGAFIGLKHKFATITIHVVGRNAFRQKRTININLPISEQVEIGERLGAERIAEAFNLSNIKA
jgi:hypothetical protein